MIRLLPVATFAVLLAAALAVALFLTAGASRDLFWGGDQAIFLIDMHHASHFSQAIGISSRFGWAHPGPLNYYLLVPFYLLSGRGVQSLQLGAFFWNCVSLFAAGAIVVRLTSRVFSSFVLAVLLLYLLVSVGAPALWNVLLPSSTIVPWILAVCLAWAIAVDGLRWTPVFALVAAFLTEAHVSLWLPCIYLGAASLILSVAGRRPTAGDLRWLLLAAAVFAVLWLPPVLEWRNLALIFKFFGGAGESEHSWREAYEALAVFVGRAAAGGPIVYVMEGPEPLHFWLGSLVFAAIAGATIVGWYRGDRLTATLGTLLVGAILVFVFGLRRYIGPILPHSVVYMTALGPFAFVLVLLPFRDLEARWIAIAATATVVGLIGLSAVPTASALSRSVTRDVEVRDLGKRLAKVLRRKATPQTVFIDIPVWPVGVGALSTVYRNGVPFRIAPFWSIIFGHRVHQSEAGPGLRVTPGPDGRATIVRVP